MKKRLILILACIAILTLGYTNEIVYAAIEEPMAGIEPILNRIDPIEIKQQLETEYAWIVDKVNFRTEASTSSDIIKTLDKRVKVEVVNSSGKWSKVRYKDITGYIYSEFLRDTELFTSDRNKWGIDPTEEEVDILAKIVWTECRGEIRKGRISVIETILNRVVAMQFPDTITEVLSQQTGNTYQFSSWITVNRAKPTKETYADIYDVLDDKTNVLSTDYLYFSTSPRNNNGTIKIGNHYFCKEDD